MRKFIMSDIHGLGNAYYSMMNYLDNISKEEEIELFINGDLIDRGIESAEVLLDVLERIKDGKFKIHYLAGNHENLMLQVYDKRRKGIHVPYCNDWYFNGGYDTDEKLQEHFDYNKDKMLEVVDFISNLDIYHKFEEKIGGKNIVLVHAACPLNVKDVCDMKMNEDTEYYLWAREHDPHLPFRCRIGNPDYFTIIGHTPNSSPKGYQYHENQNYLNIDGGCAKVAVGIFSSDHFPLVEVKDDYLKILTFNMDNQITYGNYFYDTYDIPMDDEELAKDRSYLKTDRVFKKLVLHQDDIVGYEDWYN